MAKRKTGELRKHESYLIAPQKQQTKTFYMNDSKTIPFERPNKYQNRSREVELVPKTLNQEKYILALLDKLTDVVVVTGPAGTGKTYLAMKAAIKSLKSGECSKIILTRPMIEVEDEKLGFLPGDINQKMEPWMLPLYDVFHEFYSIAEVQGMIENNMIEIAPLSFMRGRTFKNAFIVLDEGQNATPNQIKMLLTRIGENSKIIITGDIEQTDRRNSKNGLLDLQERIKRNPITGLKLCQFELSDVQRHQLIEHILKMYAA